MQYSSVDLPDLVGSAGLNATAHPEPGEDDVVDIAVIMLSLDFEPINATHFACFVRPLNGVDFLSFALLQQFFDVLLLSAFLCVFDVREGRDLYAYAYIMKNVLAFRSSTSSFSRDPARLLARFVFRYLTGM